MTSTVVLEMAQFLRHAFLILVLVHGSITEIVFEHTPQDEAIVYGQELFLDCVAMDTDTGLTAGSMVQWRLNGEPRNPKTSIFANNTLLVPNLDSGDIGNYSCVIYDQDDRVLLESGPAEVIHAYIKMFEVSPSPVTAIEDDLVSFDCITGESAPPPEIFWERNGEPFYGGNQYNATYGGDGSRSLMKQYSMKLMLVAKPHLDGTFNCVARNPVLQINVHSFKVLLETAEHESPPYVMEDMVTTYHMMPLGQPMVLDCPISGKPTVTFTWFKDTVAVDNTGSFLILQNGSLHNPSMLETDGGVYYCTGENTLGVATSGNITVDIAKLEIDFVEQPEDVYLIAGHPARLHCIPPISVPTATVTWYKNGKLLVPRTGQQSMIVQRMLTGSWDVVFEEIQKVDEGEYFCVANNAFAVPATRTSIVATISVGGAPIFTEPPTGLTIQKNSLAKLSCFVQGDPFPRVTWLFEDQILEANEHVSFRESNQELWIGNIHKGFEGTYTCRAQNRYGMAETRVYIKVLVPPVILQHVGNVMASAGDPAIIPCGVYSDPEPQVKWFKDNSALMTGGRITQVQDGLYIAVAMPEDEGQYLCVASNIAGSVESNGTLTIQLEPQFLVRPENRTVTIGNNVTLTCVATGYPKPNITWLFNGSKLFPQDTFQSLDREHLFLLEVDWQHVGRYTCEARNPEGHATSSAKLTLQIPPKVKQIEGVPLLYQGEDLALQCRASGVPVPSVEWFKDRVAVRESLDGRVMFPDSQSLLIKFVTVEDAGLYTCKVTNAAGVSERDIGVVIIERPNPPVLYKAEVSSATSVVLGWSIDQEQPQTPVDHVLIYFRKKTNPVLQLHNEEIPSSVLQFEVTGLDPASDYIFMVAAVNEAGESDASNVLAATTYDSGPSEPRSFQAVDVHAHNITLQWEVPEITNGEIRKYQLRYTEKHSTDEKEVAISTTGRPSEQVLVDDLQPYTWYMFDVRAATMEGDMVLWGNVSQPIDVKTSEAAPTGAPMEVRARGITPDTVQVKWEAIEQHQQNGPIKRYYIKYWLLSNLTHKLGEKVSESLDLQVNVSDLDPWQWYTFKVTAENDGGVGVASPHITARTLPTAPSAAPLNVSAEVESARSIVISWQPPPVDHWNSALAGYIVQVWDLSNGTAATISVLDDTSYTLSGLQPWTVYEVRLAAFTDQIRNGTGPFSENVTVKTQESVPGPVEDITHDSQVTAIKLSWKPPAVTNGDITEYLIQYFVVGSSIVTTPAPDVDNITSLLMQVSNETDAIGNYLNENSSDIHTDDWEVFAEMCDILLSNETALNILLQDMILSEAYISDFNMSDSVIDWYLNVNQTLPAFCGDYKSAIKQVIAANTAEVPVPVEVYNMTTVATSITVRDLEAQTIYNVSVMAATGAGYGETVTIQAVTLKRPPVIMTTRRPQITTRRPPQTTPVPLEQQGDNLPASLPVMIGGGVAGLVAIVIILILAICLFRVKRRRGSQDEKVKVISQSTKDDDSSSIATKYGQLDRPTRSSQRAQAAEDGTDTDSRLSGNVGIYGNRVNYQSPSHAGYKDSEKSFVTNTSGEPTNNGQRIKEAFLGMDQSGYLHVDRPPTMRNNPAYLEEPSSSDMESMTVSMAFSAEDVLSQGDGTLKRKSKMMSVDAAAIARLRNSHVPGMSERDTSSLINNDAEVIFNERTAL